MSDRAAIIILVEIDSSSPSADLDNILGTGATAHGYVAEELVVSEAIADVAWKLCKT